jgi:hypothetical protein
LGGAVTATAAGYGNVDGQGFRNAQVVFQTYEPAGGGGADTLEMKVQASPRPLVSDNLLGYDGIDDGGDIINNTAGDSVRFAIPFITVGAKTILAVRLRMSKNGVPALAGGGTPAVHVSFQGDAVGVPDLAPIGGNSRSVNCLDIGADIQEVEFVFDVGVDLVAATPYWLIVDGDYDADNANSINLHYNTSAASGCVEWDGTAMPVPAWSAPIVVEDFWYEMDYLVYTDVAAAYVIPSGSAVFTEGTILNPESDGVSIKEVNLMPINNYLRIYLTITPGGTWPCGCVVNLGDPEVLPAR